MRLYTPGSHPPPPNSPATSRKPPDVNDTLVRAAEEYRSNDVAAAVNTLSTSPMAADPKIKLPISRYKLDGAPKMVHSAHDLYRAGRYREAVDMLTDAEGFGSKDARAVLPQYRSRLAKVQEEEAERTAKLALQSDRERAKDYEGDGDVQIAVSSATAEVAMVSVLISARNNGQSIAHVNPNDFTLADPNGLTVPYDNDPYNTPGIAMSKYLNAVDLRPSQSTSGWLTFNMQKYSRYTLSYQGLAGTAQKAVIP
jgi:hypothetical protein